MFTEIFGPLLREIALFHTVLKRISNNAIHKETGLIQSSCYLFRKAKESKKMVRLDNGQLVQFHVPTDSIGKKEVQETKFVSYWKSIPYTGLSWSTLTHLFFCPIIRSLGIHQYFCGVFIQLIGWPSHCEITEAVLISDEGKGYDESIPTTLSATVLKLTAIQKNALGTRAKHAWDKSSHIKNTAENVNAPN